MWQTLSMEVSLLKNTEVATPVCQSTRVSEQVFEINENRQ